MSITDMERKAREIKELKRMAEELEAEITTLEDEVKAAMGDQEQVVAGAFKISWKPVTSSRVDAKALKAQLPDIAERFTVTSSYKRFQIA